MKFNPVATRDLNITYFKPLKCNIEYILECEVDNIDDKWINIKGKIQDENGLVFTTGEGRFK